MVRIEGNIKEVLACLRKQFPTFRYEVHGDEIKVTTGDEAKVKEYLGISEAVEPDVILMEDENIDVTFDELDEEANEDEDKKQKDALAAAMEGFISSQTKKDSKKVALMAEKARLLIKKLVKKVEQEAQNFTKNSAALIHSAKESADNCIQEVDRLEEKLSLDVQEVRDSNMNLKDVLTLILEERKKASNIEILFIETLLKRLPKKKGK